ncbi:MAG: GAF domain-containing protein [Armatimonadetes bacterium]|nr:GAF domain-containing protein [Armatimonadota bacterium]
MPLSPSGVSALRKIAEMAGSHEPASDRLEQILGVAREALGIPALSVVALRSASDDAAMWHSTAHGYTLDPVLVKQEALKANGKLKHGKDVYVRPLSPVDGYQPAMVALGNIDTDEHAALLQIVASFVSVLIENEELAELLDRSKDSAHQRIEEIAAIYEVGQAMDGSDIHRVLDIIVRKAAAVMDAQTCSLMLRDERDGALVIETSCGLSDEIVKDTRIGFGEGIAGQVAESGEPMLIVEVDQHPKLKQRVKGRPGISGSICVPLKDEEGAVRGVLSIRRHVPKPPFNESDLRLFSVFAIHAALAISNAQLYSRLHQKLAEMSRISHVLRAINSTLDLEHVLSQIVESITEGVGFDRCCVYLLDSRTNEFVAGARKGYQKNDRVADRIKPGEGVIGLAAREQIPIFSKGSPIDSDNAPCAGEFLAAPIVVRDSTIGVLVVDNCKKNRPIEPEHVELLATFVSQAGIAVENARLYEAMEEKYSELNVLYEHSRSISAAYGLDNTAEMLVRTASKAVRCDGAGLLLLDTKRDHLRLQASSGAMAKHTQEVERVVGEGSAVDFVRRLRTPALISVDSQDRRNGANADLLNALAPGKANLMLAPLVTEDTTVGVLAIHRGKGEEFQAEEFKLLSIVAAHAATVLKNAMSYEQKMRQRVLELTALYDFSKKISSAANLEEALDSILSIVADLADHDESFIYAIDQDRGVAAVKAARFRGSPETIPPEEPLDGGSVVSWAIKERKALVSPDISLDSRFSKSGMGRPNVRSLMSIPLMVQDEVVGVLSVHSQSPNQYSEDDVRVLSIIASQGAAIYKELEALTALTSYTDNILSSIAAGVATLDSDGVLLTWNRAAESIVGVKASKIVGMDYQQVLAGLTLAEADKENVKWAIESVFDTGQTYQGYKLCFHPRNRDDVYINMSVSQLLSSSGEQLGLVVIFEDITREIKMEDDFRRMGELAAVGQLAASIAHELRNPLSSIKGAAQFLMKENESDASIVEFLGIIVEEVNGLNRLTTEFLDFARPMQLELKPMSVNRVAERTLQLMSVHITDNNVVVREDLSASIPEIQGDESQLEQVLKNMIINSLQAMPEGGVLTVETGPTPAGGAYMSVSDTGLGISPDKLDRIFQPFFTTKTKGTGLGLSVVHKIVENHGGKIEVSSKMGEGSTFKVVLPRTGIHTPIISTELNPTMERRVSGELRGGEVE